MIVPYQAFAAADGYLMVAAGNDNLFRRLCDVIARPELADDARFRTNKDRVVNRAALIGILEDIFAAQPIAVWKQRLDAAGIPNGPMQTVDQVVSDPQTAALGIIQQLFLGASREPLSLVGLPLSFDGLVRPFQRRRRRLANIPPQSPIANDKAAEGRPHCRGACRPIGCLRADEFGAAVSRRGRNPGLGPAAGRLDCGFMHQAALSLWSGPSKSWSCRISIRRIRTTIACVALSTSKPAKPRTNFMSRPAMRAYGIGIQPGTAAASLYSFCR